MAKKIIAVDLDDVLSLYGPAFVEFNNSKWQMNITLDEVSENWAKMWGMDYSEMEERAQLLHKELFKNLGSVDNAQPVLERLAKQYRLVVATSRRKTLEKDTKIWIDEYFPDIFDEVHHAGIFDEVHTDHTYNKTKLDLCQRIGADYLIDDQPKHCLAVSDTDIKPLLFGDYPWNRDTNLPNNITRVRDWEDIARFFDV